MELNDEALNENLSSNLESPSTRSVPDQSNRSPMTNSTPHDLLSYCPSLIHILTYVHPFDLNNCRRVSRHFNNVAKQNSNMTPKHDVEIKFRRIQKAPAEAYIFVKVGFEYLKEEGYKQDSYKFVVRKNEIAVKKCNFDPFLSCYEEPIDGRRVDGFEEGLRVAILPILRLCHFHNVKMFYQDDLETIPLEWCLILAQLFKENRTKIARLELCGCPELMQIMPKMDWPDMTIGWSNQLADFFFQLPLDRQCVNVELGAAEEHDMIDVQALLLDLITKWHAGEFRIRNVFFLDANDDLMETLEGNIDDWLNGRDFTKHDFQKNDFGVPEHHTFIRRPLDDIMLGLIWTAGVTLCIYDEQFIGPLGRGHYDYRFTVV